MTIKTKHIYIYIYIYICKYTHTHTYIIVDEKCHLPYPSAKDVVANMPSDNAATLNCAF